MLNNAITLLAAVEKDPLANAIIDSNKKINYQDLLEIASRIGTNLITKGLHKGDHLIIVSENNWQSAVIYWACQLYGIIITPVNWRSTPNELDYFIGNSKARAIIFQDTYKTLVFKTKLSKDILTIEFGRYGKTTSPFDDLLKETNSKEQYVKNNDLTSILLYTSGTTGLGKGVPRSHLAEKTSALAHVSQNKYNYREILEGIKDQQEYFSNLALKPEEELTRKEIDFIDIYNKVIIFDELSRSLTCLLPAIRIEDEAIAESLNINKEEIVSYFFFIRNIEKFKILLKNFIDKDREEWTESDVSLSSLMLVLQQIEQDSFSKRLKIIPPDPYDENASWVPPWEILIDKKFTNNQRELLFYLENIIHSIINSDQNSAEVAVKKYKETLSKIYDSNTKLLKREVWYNKANLLYIYINLDFQVVPHI